MLTETVTANMSLFVRGHHWNLITARTCKEGCRAIEVAYALDAYDHQNALDAANYMAASGELPALSTGRIRANPFLAVFKRSPIVKMKEWFLELHTAYMYLIVQERDPLFGQRTLGKTINTFDREKIKSAYAKWRPVMLASGIFHKRLSSEVAICGQQFLPLSGLLGLGEFIADNTAELPHHIGFGILDDVRRLALFLTDPTFLTPVARINNEAFPVPDTADLFPDLTQEDRKRADDIIQYYHVPMRFGTLDELASTLTEPKPSVVPVKEDTPDSPSEVAVGKPMDPIAPATMPDSVAILDPASTRDEMEDTQDPIRSAGTVVTLVELLLTADVRPPEALIDGVVKLANALFSALGIIVERDTAASGSIHLKAVMPYELVIKDPKAVERRHVLMGQVESYIRAQLITAENLRKACK